MVAWSSKRVPMEDLVSVRSKKSSPEVTSDSDSNSRKDGLRRLSCFRLSERVTGTTTGEGPAVLALVLVLANGAVLIVRMASEEGLLRNGADADAASSCCAALLFSVTVSSLLLLLSPLPLPPEAADRAEVFLARICMFEWRRLGARHRPTTPAPAPGDVEAGGAGCFDDERAMVEGAGADAGAVGSEEADDTFLDV
jgi:hypothetical protein